MTALSNLGLQLGLVLLVLTATFCGPVLAVWLLVMRKRRARAAKKSPIGIELLRSPGHELREQLDELRLDVMGDLLGLSILPSLLLAIHLSQSYVLHSPETVFRAALTISLSIGCIAWFIRKLLRSSVLMDKLRLGFDAELAVGQELDRLSRQGAQVFHDVPAERFNIDHVVVARQGVFAVETKGYSKRKNLPSNVRAKVTIDGEVLRFPDWSSAEPVHQAARQAKWLAVWLSNATAHSVEPIPVLALPGWYVKGRRAGSVEVYSGRQLGSLLMRPPALTSDDVQRIAHQLDQRCRNVAPSYRDEDATTSS